MRTTILFSTLLILASCQKTKVEPVKATPTAELGEGAIWHPDNKALLWVDITGKKVFMYHPQKGMLHNLPLESMVGTVVPAQDGYLAVAAQETGIYGITPDEKLKLLTPFPADAAPNVRFNDGKCDPMGRFWVGTMSKSEQPNAGNLYMLDGDTLVVKQSGVTISNGIVWDTNKNLMYYIDTPTQSVFAYDYVPETGEIANRRVVVSVPKEMGSPDGMTIDSEGKLWIAHWGGYGVYRWDPDNGELLQKIEVPAPHVTSCAFGGKKLKTLYITTARVGLTKEQLDQYPLSGSLFAVKTKVKGIPACLFSEK
ncbi:SMP-30/gluconolactonase/LRE family protein [Thermophagus sp. OGC60D27]|uniref:SMP-30/gluconolactonase/LRE family protein n=1 Tax=Thermophagus sp. OGC60D27 TaxID=3458415 RepID=UPI00403786DA